MFFVFGQIPINDAMIARYTADKWRGRVYAVRYFITYLISGAAASMIALLHARGGFDLVLGVIAVVALVAVACGRQPSGHQRMLELLDEIAARTAEAHLRIWLNLVSRHRFSPAADLLLRPHGIRTLDWLSPEADIDLR